VAFKFPWSAKDSHRDDPYWDFFINKAPADLTNTVTELMRKAPAGNIFPTKAELHTPEITASHVKGMAQYFGADDRHRQAGRIDAPSFTPPPRGEGKVRGETARGKKHILSPSSAPSTPTTIRALRPASAAKCRCKTVCSSPLF
jgi:hypothetical protein